MASFWGILGMPGANFGTLGPQEQAETPNPLASGIASIGQHFAGLPRRAFDASENYRKGGEYDPAPIVEAATLPMGTGAIAGVPMRAGEAVLGAGPIRAYHGSPYDFNAFDTAKIGTGEGAQAYGHGLYFAENEGVARSYRPGASEAQGLAQWNLDRAGGDVAAAKARYINDLAGWKQPPDPAVLAAIEKPPGHMYEVNINADQAHFLDWDKPLAAQSGYINDKLKNVFDQSLAGREAYQSLIKDRPNSGGGMSGGGIRLGATPEAASGRFNATGVPGIKYLDQGSRAAGDGSRNYVVFDPKIVDIMKKYGLAGMAVPAAAGMSRSPILGFDN